MAYHLLGFDLPGVVVDRTQVDGDILTVEARTTSTSASCPSCRQMSDRVHSRYIRSPMDLPISQYSVRLTLLVRRFTCRNGDCPRLTFAERLPQIVCSHARRTVRLTHRLRMLAFAVGGRPGARLGHVLDIATSRDSLLRTVRLTGLTQHPTPRVLGVDDFARRRGQTYGTILVDLERRRPVDLLLGRSADVLRDWLKLHPGVEVIARDRSREYARGAADGAPKARQIADRWHLLVNLREALERYLTRVHARLRALPVDHRTASVLAADRHRTARPLRGPTESEQRTRELRRDHRKGLWLAAREMFDRGDSIREIARQLGLSWTTARNLAHTAEYPERNPKAPQASLIDPYAEYLISRWDEGCHNASQLWREVTERGYEGARIQVARWARAKREAPAPTTPSKYPQPDSTSEIVGITNERVLLSGPRQLAWLLMRPESQLDETDKAAIAHVRRDSELEMVCGLAERFRDMVRDRRPQELDEWIRTATTSDVSEFRYFAICISRDAEAVRYGLSEPWSNGQTEAQITKLKLIKRQMYGRANFDLLRLRVLGVD